MSNTVAHLQQVVLIRLEVSLFSGRKQMKISDLRDVQGNQLPPAEMASLGHKKICDPKDLADFSRLKKEAERACLARGCRFLGGYAVPDDQFKDLAKELDRIKREFFAAKSDFLAHYDDRLEAWIRRYPDWESVIREGIPPRQVVEQRLHFGWAPLRVSPVQAPDDETPEGDLSDEVHGLSGQLFREISQLAEETYRKSFEGRPKVTQKAKRPLVAMRDKLDGLSFIDARVSPVVDEINRVLDALPKAGPIDGPSLSAMTGLVRLLADTEAMKRHGEGVINGDGSDQDATDPLDLPEVTQAQPDSAVAHDDSDQEPVESSEQAPESDKDEEIDLFI